MSLTYLTNSFVVFKKSNNNIISTGWYCIDDENNKNNNSRYTNKNIALIIKHVPDYYIIQALNY